MRSEDRLRVLRHPVEHEHAQGRHRRRREDGTGPNAAIAVSRIFFRPHQSAATPAGSGVTVSAGRWLDTNQDSSPELAPSSPTSVGSATFSSVADNETENTAVARNLQRPLPVPVRGRPTSSNIRVASYIVA